MKPPVYIDPTQFAGLHIPKWLAEKEGISWGAKICFALLAQRYNPELGHDRATPKILAKELGTTIREVNGFVRSLKRHGLVSVDKVPVKNSRKRSGVRP